MRPSRTALALALAVGLLAPAGPVGAAGAAPSVLVAQTGPSGATGTATTPAPAPEPGAAPSAADGSVARAADREPTATDPDDAPVALVLLAVLAGLAVVGLLAWALARALALQPRWAARARHATGEAGWRVSATWAEFADWVRLGR